MLGNIPLEKVKERIANTSVGSSTLRGQPKGSVGKARDYLKKIDLNEFSKITEENEYINMLDNHTRYMDLNTWGFARKVINIFMFEVTNNIYLSERYNLTKIVPFLETPLDNPSAITLVKEAKRRGVILYWKNIKSLKKEESDKIQGFAKEYAKDEYGAERCYLELILWRGENSQ